MLRPSVRQAQDTAAGGEEGKRKRAGETRPFQFQQEILGLAVPTPEDATMEAAGHAVTEAPTAEMSEPRTMIEATTHAMGEAVVAAVPDIISTIGQIA
jgi:hypothetical protein